MSLFVTILTLRCIRCLLQDKHLRLQILCFSLSPLANYKISDSEHLVYQDVVSLFWVATCFRDIFKKTLFNHCTKKWSFPLRISSVNEEILNGKLHFLCSEYFIGEGLSRIARNFVICQRYSYKTYHKSWIDRVHSFKTCSKFPI